MEISELNIIIQEWNSLSNDRERIEWLRDNPGKLEVVLWDKSPTDVCFLGTDEMDVDEANELDARLHDFSGCLYDTQGVHLLLDALGIISQIV